MYSGFWNRFQVSSNTEAIMCEQGKMPMPPDIDMDDDKLLAQLEQRQAQQNVSAPPRRDSREPDKQ